MPRNRDGRKARKRRLRLRGHDDLAVLFHEFLERAIEQIEH
jgi:hypothetical protein